MDYWLAVAIDVRAWIILSSMRSLEADLLHSLSVLQDDDEQSCLKRPTESSSTPQNIAP